MREKIEKRINALGTLFPFSVFLYQIRILQLENYDVSRFSVAVLRALPREDTEQEKDIRWTLKIALVSALAFMALVVVVFSLLSEAFESNLMIVATSALIILSVSPVFWIFLSLATVVLSPLDLLAKERIIRQARIKLSRMEDVTVIGITGSYGKTTMKEILKTMLSIRYRVVATKESYNTPIGISREILESVMNGTDIFIAEMGAYERGDIEKLCAISSPGISILTGINEAHLERFGNIENTIETKFEIVDGCLADGNIILNADDERVTANYKRHIGNQEVHFYTSEENSLSHYSAKNISFDEEIIGISFALYREQKEIGLIKTRFISNYIIGDIITAFIVGNILGMTDAEIQAGIREIRPAEHRLKAHKTPNDMVIIDDSYNGNPTGAHSAIIALSRFKNRRKIYITPGLVEMGDRTEEVHEKIGEMLGNTADVIFLIENSTTESIKKGIENTKFNSEYLYTYEDKREAYKKLGHIAMSGDVILFQNDWPENYH